jgi:hypothetical protein
MKLRAQIAHQTKGRIRVLFPDHRGDRAFFEQVVQLIADSDLVQAARANPLTGSLVLEFSGSPEDLLAKFKKLVPIEIVPAPPPPRVGPSSLAAANDPLKLVSGRDINPMLMAGTLFGAVGMVQAWRGHLMIPALSAFWYAANAFRMARDPRQGSAADQVRVDE